MNVDNRILWLIDASYLFNSQDNYEKGYRFDYLKLRNKLEYEEKSSIWRAYYLNASRYSDDPQQEGFHNWLRSAPPNGPKFITQIYTLRGFDASYAYCRDCGKAVQLSCPNQVYGEEHHDLSREQQKGVDVGLAIIGLRLVEEYKVLILSSGDGDLCSAIDYLTEQKKKQFKMAVFRGGVATELQSRADKIYWLDDMADEIQRSDRTG